MNFSFLQWVVAIALDALLRFMFGMMIIPNWRIGAFFLSDTVMHFLFLIPISVYLVSRGVRALYRIPLSLIGANVLFCGLYAALWTGLPPASPSGGGFWNDAFVAFRMRGFLESVFQTLTYALQVQVTTNLVVVLSVWSVAAVLGWIWHAVTDRKS